MGLKMVLTLTEGERELLLALVKERWEICNELALRTEPSAAEHTQHWQDKSIEAHNLLNKLEK
jgi:hypothetical protein